MQIASRGILWSASAGGGDTVLVVEPSADCMTVCLASGALAVGSVAVTIDWGDGTVEARSGIGGAKHTYGSVREYRVTISDDIASFGFVDRSSSMAERNALRELVRLGSRVTSIAAYAFNNCHNMRGVIGLPNVATIGNYAFGSAFGITDFILPSLRHVVQTSFYCAPGPAQMHVDNADQIDSRFWEYYGGHLLDMYIRSRTRAEIKAMSGFPFCAGATVRFHGSDGIVMGNGTFA